MTLYFLFLGVTASTALLAACMCRWKITRFVGVWAALSIGLAVIGSAVPWRTRDGSLAGQGAPIPFEMIEHYQNGGAADFPWPAAIVLSPLALFVGGMLLALFGCVVRKVVEHHVVAISQNG